MFMKSTPGDHPSRAGKFPLSVKQLLSAPSIRAEALPKNYSPLALTSHRIIEVSEKVVRKRIVAFMDEHIMTPDSQIANDNITLN